MKTILKRCPACGEGPVAMVSRPGRTQRYRNMTLAVPADLALAECTSCGEGFVDDADAATIDARLEIAYQHELRRRAVGFLDKLSVAIAQRRLEVLLGLSVGYLSKIRSKEFPSAPLVTELAILAADPETGIALLERFWAAKPPRERSRRS